MLIFVTGLCLQGNKGGPALAISLMNKLKKYNDEIEFRFSVPGNEPYFQLEQKWAKIYGVQVVKAPSLKDLIPPWSWWRVNGIKQCWFDALAKSDLLLELSAISYVGPPTADSRASLLQFSYYWLCRRLGKPFLRWTQSYGPFSSWLVRTLAKIDLDSQEIIFCRGETTQKMVNQLLPNKKTLSFPDVAVVLPYSSQWGRDFLNNEFGLVDKSRLVTVSPSSVIYSSDLFHSTRTHVEDLAKFCDYLIENGYQVLLVPHTLRVIHRDPRTCDLGVCLKIQSVMKYRDSVYLLEDDLSPIELKGILSNAFIHVGARYHSVIAALSSGIPSISLSWHHKYKDIMNMYGVEDYVFVSRPGAGINDLIKLFVKILQEYNGIKETLIDIQPHIERQVEENTRIFINLIKQVIT